MYSHKRESRRPKKRTGETFHTGKNTDRIKKFGITLKLRADEADEGEKAALSRLSEAEYHTRLLLEDPKNHILSEARSESYTVRSKIRDAHAGDEDKNCRHCPSRIEQTIHSHRLEHHHTGELTERIGLAPS